MKLESIKKLAKETKHIIIFDSGAEQWISNSECAVPLTGLPRVDKNNVLRLLSLDDEEEKYTIETHPDFPLQEDDFLPEGDTEAKYINVGLVYQGCRCSLFDTAEGIIAVEAEYIRLFGWMRYPRFALRDRMLAVFDGLILVGYIQPIVFSESIIGELGMIQAGIRKAQKRGFTITVPGAEQVEMEG